MSEVQIKLYKIRDFSAKINATIEYIRYNFKSLLKVVLLVVIPLGLIFGISFSNLFTSMFEITATNPNMTDEEAFGFLGVMLSNYTIIFTVSLITYAFLFAGIYSFMQLRDINGDLSVSHVYGNILRKIPGLVLLMILITIISFIGFFIFIIPGIYLGVTLSLSIPIYLFEDIDIGRAFGKSFSLIREKWWSTFGLLIISSIIAGVVSYVFAIPFYIFMVGGMFSAVEEAANDPEAVFSIFTDWSTSLGMAIMTMGSYITYMIPVIALAFQYFNLVERQEGRGIRNEIKDFESLG